MRAQGQSNREFRQTRPSAQAVRAPSPFSSVLDAPGTPRAIVCDGGV